MNEIVCFMPIRLNSQRIKNKSIVNVCGRPLFCWSLETLDKLNIPVYIFTNDSETLKDLIDFKSNNIHWLNRPKYCDDHDTKGIDIYKEFSNLIPSENYLLAHCTSPFVKLESYKKCIDAVLKDGYYSSMTVKEEKTFIWYKEKKLNFSIPRQKTQDLEPVFLETSAAYCFKVEILNKNSRSCENPKFIVTDSIEAIDIDEQEDLELLRRFK